MNKTIKAVFYGEPGVGKSVFAFAGGINKPFFITTDDNYAYLEDWGAKEEDHVKVDSWKQAKEEFKKSFDGYDTIVVDLIEDLYLWAEDEFIKQNKITDLSDLGYGKGYKQVRKDFFLTIKSLINKPKNIILLSHGITIKNKDKRGVEYLKFAPSDKISEKLWTDIVGSVRYCLRCYATPEEDELGNLVIKRYLSLSPDGTTEYGVIRGVPDTKFPAKIPLDWQTFIETVAFSAPKMNIRTSISGSTTTIEPEVVKENPIINTNGPIVEAELKESSVAENNNEEVTPTEPIVEKPTLRRGRPAKQDTSAEEQEAEPAPTKKDTPIKSKAEMTKEEKIAEIKRKLAAAKAAKQ